MPLKVLGKWVIFPINPVHPEPVLFSYYDGRIIGLWADILQAAFVACPRRLQH
jgi:hypothetical protein